MHERVYDEFVEKSKVRAQKRVVGDPFRNGVEQGPQVQRETSSESGHALILSRILIPSSRH